MRPNLARSSQTKSQSTPQVTVNILSYNRCAELKHTLKKVYESIDYPITNLEIIVVDNASTDGTVEMLETTFPFVHIVRLESNRGIAAWNEGFASGTGEYFLVLDDDAYIEGDTLRKAVKAMDADDGLGILSFNVIDPGTRYCYTIYRPFGVFSFWGCAALFRRELIEQTGGFDPNIFVYSHEHEIALHAKKLGYSHQVSIDLIAYHKKDPSQYDEYNRFKLFNETFSRHYSYFRHLTGIRYFRFLLLSILVNASLCAFVSFRHRRLETVFLLGVFKAIQRARKTSTPTNPEAERFFMRNAMACSGFLHRLRCTIQKSPKPLIKFYERRKPFYPDFDPEYLLTYRPYQRHKEND